jgi:hypothetical protein
MPSSAAMPGATSTVHVAYAMTAEIAAFLDSDPEPHARIALSARAIAAPATDGGGCC